MARPYAKETAGLANTFEWASAVSIDALRQAVRLAGTLPLQAVGSGGSLTAAHAIAHLQQSLAGRLASVSTPLECVGDALTGASHWLLSAGGGNVDIIGAAKSLIAREPRQLAVLCGRSDSALAELCRQHSFSDLLIFPPPAGKDGFLATNSLLGFVTLLARAYALEFGQDQLWSDNSAIVNRLFMPEAKAIPRWHSETKQLWERSTTLVIHGPTTKVGAIDLESKFTEAALGNLQLADYRNFAHGRHHWLAKRGDVSGVLALVSDQDRALARKTLRLIPTEVPVAEIDIDGPPLAAMLSSLIAALRITEWAGEAKGIDPGRPGVPQFGRKLYSLPLPRVAELKPGIPLTHCESAAIARKAGKTPVQMKQLELTRWKDAGNSYRLRLAKKEFAAIAFDYDGTLVETRDRFQPPISEVTDELIRIVDGGVRVAIATGRGSSVGRDLRNVLPETLWGRVIVGYYNGAEIADLAAVSSPDNSPFCHSELLPLADALRRHPELASVGKQTDRKYQITLEAKGPVPVGRLWDIAHQVIVSTGSNGVKVTRSTHSVDIVAASVSKRNVIERLRQETGEYDVLAIGDRGRWPGNDFELLEGPDSLSVDETNVDPESCWNLASRGHRGVQATLEYLRSLNVSGGRVAFREGAFR